MNIMAVTTTGSISHLALSFSSVYFFSQAHPYPNHKLAQSQTQARFRKKLMGNMLPCLVQGTALPTSVSPKQRLRSLKLLMKALNKMKKGPCNNAKIASKSSPPVSATAAGGEEREEGEVKSKASSKHVSPRRAAHAGRGGGVHRKGVVRVKVVLTKEEAARLLSLTTVGGQKTAAQIVAEINRMEARRAANAAAAAAPAWRPALESIPEESP